MALTNTILKLINFSLVPAQLTSLASMRGAASGRRRRRRRRRMSGTGPGFGSMRGFEKWVSNVAPSCCRRSNKRKSKSLQIFSYTRTFKKAYEEISLSPLAKMPSNWVGRAQLYVQLEKNRMPTDSYTPESQKFLVSLWDSRKTLTLKAQASLYQITLLDES